MNYPIFFDEIEHIAVKDELSLFLGATNDGIFDISYTDVVKLAGHSCVTVAGSYLMALYGLKELYKGEMPVRGEIKVEIQAPKTSGNTPVIGNVLSYITGATTDNGFQGIKPQFNRRNLLFFGADINGTVKFTNLKTNKSAEVYYKPQEAVNPKPIMQKGLKPSVTEKELMVFKKEWQNLVKTLFDEADKVIQINA